MRTRFLTVALIAAALLAGCADDDVEADPSSTPTPSPTASASPSPSPTASPTSKPTPTTTPPSDAVTVQLTGAGVGSMDFGTIDPTGQLVDWFGSPDDTVQIDPACGNGNNVALNWGDLSINYDGDELWGWEVRGTNLPEGVEVPYGYLPGTTMTQVRQTTGASTIWAENYQLYTTTFGSLSYWSATHDGPYQRLQGGHIANCG